MNLNFYSRELSAEEGAFGFGLYLVEQVAVDEELPPEPFVAVLKPIEPSDAVFKLNNPMSGKPEYVHFCYGTKIFDHEEEEEYATWHPTTTPQSENFRSAATQASPAAGLHGSYQVRRYPFRFRRA